MFRRHCKLCFEGPVSDLAVHITKFTRKNARTHQRDLGCRSSSLIDDEISRHSSCIHDCIDEALAVSFDTNVCRQVLDFVRHVYVPGAEDWSDFK